LRAAKKRVHSHMGDQTVKPTKRLERRLRLVTENVSLVNLATLVGPRGSFRL
jgi:hypothetical protein